MVDYGSREGLIPRDRAVSTIDAQRAAVDARLEELSAS
jgi:hypothetical protein